MSRDMTKPIKWVCAQRRLRSALPVWSKSSLSTWRKIGSLATHWAHSKDSDQTGRMPRLIWVFAGRTVTLLVLSCRGSYAWNVYFQHKTGQGSYGRPDISHSMPQHDKNNKVRPAKTQLCQGIRPVWSRVFAVRSMGGEGPKLSSCGQWRLIRLGGSPGWPESLLGAHTIGFVMPWLIWQYMFLQEGWYRAYHSKGQGQNQKHLFSISVHELKICIRDM